MFFIILSEGCINKKQVIHNDINVRYEIVQVHKKLDELNRTLVVLKNNLKVLKHNTDTTNEYISALIIKIEKKIEIIKKQWFICEEDLKGEITHEE